jgi:hypothetical protein
MNREILGQTYWISMTLPGSRQDDDDGYPLAAIKIAAKTLTASLLLASLQGCALLRSQVDVVHQLPKDVSGTTYVMIPFKEQEGKLQHKAYEEAVRKQLNAKGFRETTMDQAQTAVFFAYGIDTGRTVDSSYPIIGQPESKLVLPPAASTAALGPPTGSWEPGRLRKLSTRVS